MIPYILFYFVIFVLTRKIINNKYNFFDYMILLIMILFSATRVGIGTDYNLYKVIFSRAYTIESLGTSRTGIGFSYLLLFIKNNLNLDYQFLIAFCSIVTILCIYFFIKNNSEKPGDSILFYISIGLYASSFNGFRQHMGIALVLAGITFFQKRKKLFGIIAWILAFLTHSISLVLMLAYYFVYKKEFNIKSKIVLLTSVILFVAYNFLFVRLLSLFPAYAGYLDFEAVPGIGTYLMILFYYFIYFVLISPNYKKFSKEEQKFISLFSIAIIVMSLQMHNWLFNRISDIFIIFVPILLSKYIKLIDNSGIKKQQTFLINIVMFIYFIVYIYSFGEVIPYRNIWFRR